MIPLLRKIRKKMADDNRPLKYMRYAIGEIILVVIGSKSPYRSITGTKIGKLQNKKCFT